MNEANRERVQLVIIENVHYIMVEIGPKCVIAKTEVMNNS